MRRICLALFLAAECSGCMTAQDAGAVIAELDDNACQSYGAEPGSKIYFTCRMVRDHQRHANNAAMAKFVLGQPPLVATIEGPALNNRRRPSLSGRQGRVSPKRP
jgi:hypothetical protein